MRYIFIGLKFVFIHLIPVLSWLLWQTVLLAWYLDPRKCMTYRAYCDMMDFNDGATWCIVLLMFTLLSAVLGFTPLLAAGMLRDAFQMLSGIFLLLTCFIRLVYVATNGVRR